jgi:hypothetical protein
MVFLSKKFGPWAGLGWAQPSAFGALMADSLISNESIKSDPVQIVVKNYLRFHQTEVRSV